jgi:hypothetical protein
VRVLPAAFSDEGLLVYSSATGEPPHAVPPSAETLWQRATFRPDPERAQAVRLVEAPSAQSGWRRMAVRAEGDTLSALVIEWELIPGR